MGSNIVALCMLIITPPLSNFSVPFTFTKP